MYIYNIQIRTYIVQKNKHVNRTSASDQWGAVVVNITRHALSYTQLAYTLTAHSEVKLTVELGLLAAPTLYIQVVIG